MKRCHARGCREPLDGPTLAEWFMCPRHWVMLPRRLKLEVWQAWRMGPWKHRQWPRREYLAAARRAIAAVAAQEAE